MRKVIFFLAFSVLAMGAWAFDFSQVCSSGQTLYYSIHGSSVAVTCPGTTSNPYPSSYERPTGSLVIPDSVTHGSTTYLVTAISSHAFDSCPGLTSVTIPASVSSIGTYAFYRCRALTAISIPNAVTSISDYAFYNCAALVDLDLPDSLISVGNSAFASCYHIDTLALPSTLQTIDDYAFAYCEAITDLVIPDAVTHIGTSAFFNNRSLVNVTLGSSLASAGNKAFSDCDAMEHLNIPPLLTAIPEAFLSYCRSLESIEIPNTVTSIGSNAFSYCNSLSEVTIPSSVQAIGLNAFSQCQSLSTVNFNADSCASMGWDPTISGYTSVFNGCPQFTTLNVGPNVKCIPDNAFYRSVVLATVNFDAVSCSYMGSDSTSAFNECDNFRFLNIGEGVTRLPDNAFARCEGLSRITFPTTMTRLGSHILYGNNNLREIISLSSNPPAVDSNTFAGVSRTIPLLVNCGDGQTYRATEYWDRFQNIQEFNGTVITLETEDLSKGTVTIVQAPDCVTSTAIIEAIPQNRYAFDHWQDGDTTNPRTLVVTCDTTFTAYFIYTGTEPEGIDAGELEQTIVTSINGAIILTGASNEELTIMDMMGRVIVREAAVDGKNYQMPAAGVYLVRLGKHSATKVVVTR